MRPLRDGGGDADEIAGQEGIGDDVSVILLPRRDDDGGIGALRVCQVADAVAQSGGGVQVHERGALGRLRIAVRHADDGGFLEAEDEVDIGDGGECVDHR